MLVGEANPPASGTEFQAMLVWMHPEPLDPHKIYLLKHTTRTVRARVKQIRYRVDINTLEHQPATKLELNEIAAVDMKTTLPLFFDPYRRESHDRQLHPDRPAHQRDRRRRNHRARHRARRASARRRRASQAQHAEKSASCASAIRRLPFGSRAARTSPSLWSAGCSTKAGKCSSPVPTIFSRTNW